jgi:replicative DNA helicase
VRIYGDLDQIPVRVARKKANPWASPVDWRQTGISVEFDQVDDYYGFEIDGNRLFLLQDMTVTHNTAFVVSAMRNAAVEFKRPVAIFSLEMSSLQLVNRLISAEAELDSDKIKKGTLADHEWQQLNHKITDLSAAPIYIDDTPALSIRELRTKCRRLRSQKDVQLIIVDYLQLMSGNTDGRGGNREQEIASISRALKGIAKELNVPVLALSQLSRSVETRGGEKRPQLSDLRESGSIEQDADMVIFLYRPSTTASTRTPKATPPRAWAKSSSPSTATARSKPCSSSSLVASPSSPTSTARGHSTPAVTSPWGCPPAPSTPSPAASRRTLFAWARKSTSRQYHSRRGTSTSTRTHRFKRRTP